MESLKLNKSASVVKFIPTESTNDREKQTNEQTKKAFQVRLQA